MPTRLLLFFTAMLIFSTNLLYAAEEFPGRAKFPEIKAIELKDLFDHFDDFIIVDARSSFEYATLKIKNSVNIPLADKSFGDELKKIRKSSNKPIVFYCNGRSCYKSYNAARVAESVHKIDNVLAFDAGVFEWTRTHPNHAVLLGKSPVDLSKLLSSKKFEEHLLSPDEFEKRTHESIVLDVRDRHQREAIGFFLGRERWVSMENTDRMKRYIDKAKQSNQALLVYDAVGKQVRWLQYTFEQEGLKNYFFMKNGAEGYYKMIGAAQKNTSSVTSND